MCPLPNDEHIILVGTNSDLISRRAVDFYEAEQVAKERGISYIEVSAKENKNVDEAVFSIVKRLLERNEKYCKERKRLKVRLVLLKGLFQSMNHLFQFL